MRRITSRPPICDTMNFSSERREKCAKKRWFSPFFHSALMKIHYITNRRTAGDSAPDFVIPSYTSLRCAMNTQILNCIESCPVDVSHLNPTISWTIIYWSINRTTKRCIWRNCKIKRRFISRSPISDAINIHWSADDKRQEFAVLACFSQRFDGNSSYRKSEKGRWFYA